VIWRKVVIKFKFEYGMWNNTFHSIHTISIVGYGNCFFRSLSFILYGHQNNQRESVCKSYIKFLMSGKNTNILRNESYSRSAVPIFTFSRWRVRWMKLQCISELYPNYLFLFRVHREVAGGTVIYDFGSGKEVTPLTWCLIQ
jgi:hypothetical protein